MKKKKKELTLKERGTILAIGLAITSLVYAFAFYINPTPFDNSNGEGSPVPPRDEILLSQVMKQKINEISPEKPRAVQDFGVTDIRYITETLVEIDYNDGNRYYTAEMNFFFDTDEDGQRQLNIIGFQIIHEGKQYARDLNDE